MTGLRPRLGSLPDPFEDIGRAHVGELVLDDQDGDSLLGQKTDGAFAIRRGLEIGAAGPEGLTERREQGVVTSNDATIYCHHRSELAEQA